MDFNPFTKIAGSVMAQKKRIRTRSQIPMIVTGAHYWFDTLQNHFHVCSNSYIPSTINTYYTLAAKIDFSCFRLF